MYYLFVILFIFVKNETFFFIFDKIMQETIKIFHISLLFSILYPFSSPIQKIKRKSTFRSKFSNLNQQIINFNVQIMGAQTSQQSEAIRCPQVFKCWNGSEVQASPFKEKMEQRFFYEIDIKDLLQSNKNKQLQREPLFQTSMFPSDLKSHSKIKKNTENYYHRMEEKVFTCKKQLFSRGQPQKESGSIETNEQTTGNRIIQSMKENQDIANLDLNSKILFHQTDSNIIQQQKFQQSPFRTESRLISVDSDFFSLRQNSLEMKTPISQSWKHFLYSINRNKFLKSNQHSQSNKNNTNSNQKSNKLINYLNTNYIGSSQGHIPDGYGEIRYHNGDMLFGYFLNNICEGKGKYIKKDGSLYQGDFLHGQASGFGIYTGSDGYIYQGQWKNNQPCGRGRAIYSDHSTYQGDFFNGKRHGSGTLIQNGCKFVGQFKNDQLQGTALFFGDNGQTYNGEWKQNLKDGFGQYTWPNGDRYLGNYKKGRREGYGVMNYQNGDNFSGNWRNGMKNGQGIYTNNETTISGFWIRSHYIGKNSPE